jgi:hypothetical protein
LCISTPSQAGIISFRTPNSSFILLRLLRSMMLCAVFLAIFRPAALVAEGCFLFALAVGLGGVDSEDEELDFGFICMIFRARLGGGGSSYGGSSSLDFVAPDSVRLCRGLEGLSLGETGGVGPLLFTAGGGRVNAGAMSLCSAGDRSVEFDGVGSDLGETMLDQQEARQSLATLSTEEQQ